MIFPESITVVRWVECLGVTGYRGKGGGFQIAKSPPPKIHEMGSAYEREFLTSEGDRHA